MKGKDWQRPCVALPLGCLSISYCTALSLSAPTRPSAFSLVCHHQSPPPPPPCQCFPGGDNDATAGRQTHLPYPPPHPRSALSPTIPVRAEDSRPKARHDTHALISIAALSTRPGDRDRRPVLPPTGRRRASKRARQSIARALGRAGGVRRIARPGTRVCQTAGRASFGWECLGAWHGCVCGVG